MSKLSIEFEYYVLQPVNETDSEFIFQALGNRSLTRYYGIHLSNKKDLQNQMEWYSKQLIEGTGIWWKIEYQSNLIGAIGFNDYKKKEETIELGFWLLPDFQGKGLMQECIIEACKFARKHFKVRYVEAFVEKENIPCIRLLDKIGFKYSGEPIYETKFGKPIQINRLIL